MTGAGAVDADPLRWWAIRFWSESGPGTDVEWGLLVAVVRFAGSLLVLAVVFANLSWLAGWADRCGAGPMYLGFVLVLSIAGHAFWKGVEVLIARMIHRGC
ncbi:hypothetical protein NOU13_31945 [Rhodococcus erythropolis]|uniref:hypothetical protein n=1 Tax=Rhodococcus erythropolis TaxID=1833 RepID=UPI0021098E8D|nr:hypothetical protein [Rhodococcus erythropolis]MCQ4129119.1 hypothetical protein [Rhodococcus erythropolis]